MKNTLLILSGVLMTTAGAATTLDSLLQEARTALAPDRRTAVFDVSGAVEGKKVVLRGEIQSAELKKKVFGFLKERGDYTIVDSVVALPHPALGAGTMGVVSVSVANIRTRPGHDSEMGTQALLGTPVRFLKVDHGDWFLIQTPDDYLGWSDDHIVRMTPEQFDAWTAKPKVIVTAEYAVVRAGLDPASDVVSDVSLGGLLAWVRDVGKGFEVEFPDGRTGFLPATSAEPFGAWVALASDTPERIIATAKRFSGVPYFWGGTSAKGLDCSGFTKTVYYLNGVVLPRDADQQAEVGVPVDTSNAFSAVRPGDLLFFGRRARDQRPARVTHVGISLGGKRFIHASSYVMVNSLDPADGNYDEGRARSFLWIRRMIGGDERVGIRRLNSLAIYGHFAPSGK